MQEKYLVYDHIEDSFVQLNSHIETPIVLIVEFTMVKHVLSMQSNLFNTHVLIVFVLGATPQHTTPHTTQIQVFDEDVYSD